MEKTIEKIEDLVTSSKDYLNTHLANVKLTAAEKGSEMVATLTARIIMALTWLLVLIFCGISLAYVLSDLTGRLWLGFLIVAGIFFLFGLFVWYFREKLFRIPAMNAMIHQMFKDHEED
jgi:hypothetical protein